ncbi:MAG TPA: succinate dehydrogenase [Myxococcales bacterium]|nr:succinate dehydrogenase [Myxococcales bacterium]
MAQALTTDQAAVVPPQPRVIARDFILARLGSLFAFAPLGVWTLVHLWHQLAAYESAQAWQTEVEHHGSDAGAFLTFGVVLIPLVWHTVWGIGRMFKSRPAVANRGFSNIRYMVQRLSAIGLLLFLGAHLYLAWFKPRFLEGHPEAFDEIAGEIRNHGPTTVVYVLGILAIAYHLANGLWSFLTMGWGITASKAALSWMEKVSVLFFLVLLVIGWAAVYGLYAAGAPQG